MTIHAKLKVTVTSTFIVRDATGLNPYKKVYEVIDPGGARCAYVDNLSEAATTINQIVYSSDDSGDVDVQVETYTVREPHDEQP